MNIYLLFIFRYRLWQKSWKAWRQYIIYCQTKAAKDKLAHHRGEENICVQVEVGLNCSTMLAYFVFIEMQMIMNTDYGKILIVFGLIVPVRMNLVMVQKPE